MRIVKCDRCGNISVWSEGGETVKASKYGGNDYEEDKLIFDAIWNIIASLADIKDELERLEEAGARPVITAGADWNGKPSIHVWDIKRIARIFGAPLEKEDGEQLIRYSFEIDGVKVFGLED